MFINRSLLCLILMILGLSAFVNANKFSAVKDVVTAQNETLAIAVKVIDRLNNQH